MSSLSQPETAPTADFHALKKEATFNQWLKIWSSIRILREQLILELAGIENHVELSEEERATVKESIGTLSAVLSLANVEGALTNIENLLAAFNYPYWPEKPEQQVNQPIQPVELPKE